MNESLLLCAVFVLMVVFVVVNVFVVVVVIVPAVLACHDQNVLFFCFFASKGC